MKPPYTITSAILNGITSISEKLGTAKAYFLDKPSPQLRKQNTIRTIHASLGIEGNTLSEDQITAILENKHVIGPKEDILEVVNAIRAYENLAQFKSTSKTSFLSAHKILMKDLISKPGQYRTQAVGIFHGSKVAHLAPPASRVHFLMTELFGYLKSKKEIDLIRSCVFHYELAFIHPFLDGNGRMARLWQTLILIETYPIFEYIPFESMIRKTQDEYYTALSVSDTAGNSTAFIEYMLRTLDHALDAVLNQTNRTMSAEQRVLYYKSLGKRQFTRMEYMNVFKTLSTATASRDLKRGVDLGFFIKTGDKRNTIYKLF